MSASPHASSLRSARPFDMAAMIARLKTLDESELAQVEDDLDFYHFTGCPTPRLQALLTEASEMRDAA